MAIDGGCSPLVEPCVYGDVGYRIPMVFVLRLIYELTTADVVHVGRTVFASGKEIAVAVADAEADLDVTVLVVASKRSDCITNTEVPEFDCVVFAGCEESVECFIVWEAALVEFHCVGMLEVAVIYDLNRLVHVRIIDDYLLIGTTYNSQRRCGSIVMEAERTYMLRCWMGKYLRQFVESSLL